MAREVEEEAAEAAVVVTEVAEEEEEVEIEVEAEVAPDQEVVHELQWLLAYHYHTHLICYQHELTIERNQLIKESFFFNEITEYS